MGISKTKILDIPILYQGVLANLLKEVKFYMMECIRAMASKEYAKKVNEKERNNQESDARNKICK